MNMKVYTKGGDKGETSLFGGSRVKKDDPRVKAYGKVDELGAQLGFLKAVVKDETVNACLDEIQKDLFVLSAELASDAAGRARLTRHIDAQDVEKLERQIDLWSEALPPVTGWIIPGEDVVSAYAHVVRTAAREAERETCSVLSDEPDGAYILRYLNRLSDFLFTASRWLAYQTQMEVIKESVIKRLSASSGNVYELADAMIAGCLEKARKMGVKVNIAIVDEGCNLVGFKRMEDAFLGSIDIAINKAKTAMRFKMTTAALGALAKPDQPLYGIQLSNGGETVIFGGGYPIAVAGKIIGGIGVSGGAVEEDEAIAEAGLEKI
jgi:ATP:cob(I)alamin adenosyltransferase